MSRTRTIRLPWTAPPLTANQRLHWAARAALTREVRYTASSRVALSEFRGKRWPYNAAHVEVWLDYWPRDKRRRDADNLVPTLKALCDGLVDAHVVADDTPDLMTKHMPRIHPPDGDPRLELTIREVPCDDA